MCDAVVMVKVAFSSPGGVVPLGWLVENPIVLQGLYVKRGRMQRADINIDAIVTENFRSACYQMYQMVFNHWICQRCCKTSCHIRQILV